MATTFDITGRINAAVSSGSLRMLKKLQTELRATAKALLKMGDKTTANALGHTAMAMDRVAAGMGKVTENSKKVVESTGKTTKAMTKAADVAKKSQGIYKQVAAGYKLNAVEAGALYKAVGRLGQKYGYAANMQKEWVPALKDSLAGIYKQKAALVASGKAITAHVSSTELFDRVNRKLALGADKVKSSFTDYGRAMENSLGRSTAFRAETTKLAKSFGAQGEAFKKQFSALTKADDLWRKHVTTLHRSGEITTKVAKQMYSASEHLNMPLEKLRANIKATVPQVGLFSRAMSSLVSHLKSFASYAAAASIISGIAGIFGLATRAIIQYDQALHDLQAITRATNDEVALMGEKIREIGRTTKFSASEVAVAMRTLGQAGFTAREAIASIGAVANLATGTLTSMATVVDLVTTAIRAFGLEATDTGRVSDIFANAVNRSKLTIDKLRIAFNYIGPIAAKTGISLEETASTTMMLANAGIRASTIGTGLRRTFQQLIEPTKELREAIGAAGYTVEDFNPQMNDMRDIIRRLTEIVPDAESAFRMFSLRSSAAVAALSSQGVASFDALHSAVLRSGTAAEMAEKQIEGLGIIFKQAWDKAQDLALALGEAGITSALRVLGKGLQIAFDGIRLFVESGLLKAIATMGVMAVAIFGVSKAWAALKMAQWVISLQLFVSQLGYAGAATETLGVALTSLQSRAGALLVIITALYAAYKLSSVLLTTKVNKANTDYIDSLDEIHKKELERLENIKRLVSTARDELSTNRERSKALIGLAALGVDLNLTIEKETGLVENLTGSLHDQVGALDKAASAFGSYKEKAKLEDLAAQARLFKETGDAIEGVVPKLANLKAQSEGLFGKMVGKIEAVIDKIPLIGSSYESNAEKLAIYRKGLDALESQQGEAYEKMITEVTSFGEVTQEVWERYMLEAGASGEDVADLFTDSTEKITSAHLEAYMKIQLAREDMTTAEKEELEKYITLVSGLFSKVNSTTARELEKGLTAIREVYGEEARIVTETYDEELSALRKQVGYTSDLYGEMVDIVREKMGERLAIFTKSYEDQKALIESQKLGMAEEQERIAELDKKFANRKLALEKEVAEALRTLAVEQLELLTEGYEEASAAYEESVTRKIAVVDRYYAYEKTKAELQITDAKALAEALVELETQRFDDLLEIGEQATEDRLTNEEAYHEEALELIESALEEARIQFEEGGEDHLKIEKDLNAKLIETDRTSMKTRLGILRDWSANLSARYTEAVENTRKYANKIIDIENEIRDIRKKAAGAIVSVTASTEDQILRIRRAGMTETKVLWSKAREANRKMAEADYLASKVGTEEALARAKTLYGEAQTIYTELGVKAAGAAKEGKSIGITHQDAEKAVRIAGNKIIGIFEKEKDASIAAKEAELTVAKQAQKSWKDLAENIKERIGDIQTDISELTGSVNSLVSSIDGLEDKEVAVGADEAKLNTSIGLVNKLWTNINALKDKTVIVTTRHVETHQAGGPVGAFARGGKLPGFGGGDKISALLEAGEFIINKSAVRKYGSAMFSAYNNMAAPVLSALSKPLQFAFGGFVGKKPFGKELFSDRRGSTNLSQLDRTITRLSGAIDALNNASSALSLGGTLAKEDKSQLKGFGWDLLGSDEREIYIPNSLRNLVGELKKDLKGIRRKDRDIIEDLTVTLTSGGIGKEEIRNRLSGRKLPRAEDVEGVILSLEEQEAELIQKQEELIRYREDLEKIREFMGIIQNLMTEAGTFTVSADQLSWTNLPYKGNIPRAIERLKTTFTHAMPALSISGFGFSDIESAFNDYLDKQQTLGMFQQSNQRTTEVVPYSGLTRYSKVIRRVFGDGYGRARKRELEDMQTSELAKNFIAKQIFTEGKQLAVEKVAFLRDEVDTQRVQESLTSVAEEARKTFDYGPISLPDTSSIERTLSAWNETQKIEKDPSSLMKKKKELEELFRDYFESLPKFAFGGPVPGSTDSLLARLTPGEFVLTADTVRQLGLPFLNALNNFKYPVPAFAGGGLVEPISNIPVANASSVQTRDIHLNVNITGAGEITEKQVRKWILPAVNKIRRLES